MARQIEQRSKRILVAMDACRQNRETLERALALAESMQAELIALFVEDEDLLNLAGLPFAREIHRMSATERKLDMAQMSRSLRRQADSLRDMLSQSMGKRRLQASLKIVQGKFMHAAMAAAVETDVAFLNALTDQSIMPVRPVRPESTVSNRIKPVWSVFDGSAESMRALQLALELSILDGGELILLVLATAAEQLPGLRQQAEQTAAASGIAVRYITLAQSEMDNLPRLIRRQGCSLLVLNRDSALFAGAAVQLWDRIGSPVVLVR